jgi:hypothetical protein
MLCSWMRRWENNEAKPLTFDVGLVLGEAEVGEK